MPLTPSDIESKQFKVAFRGYSLDEVDAFLDEVQSEIGRLLRENDQLRAAPAPAAAAPAERPLGGTEGQEAALRTLLLAQRTADEAVAEARAEAAQIVEAARSESEATLGSARAEADTTLTDARAEAERTVTQAQELAERTVTQAQELAERTVSEARAEAESTLSSARTEAATALSGATAKAEAAVSSAREEADATLSAARAEAESTLTGARTEADATLTAARTESTTTLARSRETAARADAEVAAKVAASLGDLDERRTALEARIEDLQSFEREYRSRLKAFLQTQLHDLEDRHGPEDPGAGVPSDAPARAAEGVALTKGPAAEVPSSS